MTKPFHLFDVTGVELEYMIVARETLAVMPLSDRVLHAVAGEYVSEIEQGDVSWSNELALHVIELKTTEPATSLSTWPGIFQEHVGRVNALLAPHGACLMPTGMHPWMRPDEFRVWPHEYNAVYEAFNRIFDCRGHGWSNLQSVHLNLPFTGDEEFGKLHAAIRVLLPILPALSASSPILEGRVTGLLDTRLDVYRNNARRIPSISGDVIPEPLFTRQDYERDILQKIYADIAPHDSAGVLQYEWLNARGAIARFDRNTIEIRVLDVQECPQADLAIAALIVAALRGLIDERWSSTEQQRSVATEKLGRLFRETCRDGERAEIADAELLEVFGELSSGPMTVNELWCRKTAELRGGPLVDTVWNDALGVILEEGPLARRILDRLQGDASPQRLAAVYRELCGCLAAGTMFRGSGANNAP